MARKISNNSSLRKRRHHPKVYKTPLTRLMRSRSSGLYEGITVVDNTVDTFDARTIEDYAVVSDRQLRVGGRRIWCRKRERILVYDRAGSSSIPGRFSDPDPDSDAEENNSEYYEQLVELEKLPNATRHKLIKKMAEDEARYTAADLVRNALDEAGGLSLKDIEDKVGMDPAQVSKICSGRHLKQGPSLYSLARIAMALGKRMEISFK